ncbi:MAG: HNH endonuclease [Treponema sp.]|nr:MAG: HNH endonuclease [Treponema sp.]
MPLKKICNHAGCSALIEMSERFCGSHKGDEKRDHVWVRKASAAWHHLYKTSRWKKISSSFLVDNPVCEECGAPSDVCDHIIPHRGDEDLFWDPINRQALCKPCHDRKTRVEMQEYRRPGRGVENQWARKADHTRAYEAHDVKMEPLDGASAESD